MIAVIRKGVSDARIGLRLVDVDVVVLVQEIRRRHDRNLRRLSAPGAQVTDVGGVVAIVVAPEPILDARGEPLGPRDRVPVPGAADVPELVVVVRRIRVYGVVDDRPVRRGPPQGRQGEGQDKQSGQQARCFSHERDKPPDLDFQARCP